MGYRYVGQQNRHHYESWTEACRVEDYAPEQVLDALLTHAAPGQTGRAFNGNEVRIELGPLGLGRIRQKVDDEAMTVTNFTVPGMHEFDPGYVTRQVVVVDGVVYIRTIGEGIGPLAYLNSVLAPRGAPPFGSYSWSDIDAAVLRDLRDEGVPTLGGSFYKIYEPAWPPIIPRPEDGFYLPELEHIRVHTLPETSR